jgi:hypothetical protein
MPGLVMSGPKICWFWSFLCTLSDTVGVTYTAFECWRRAIVCTAGHGIRTPCDKNNCDYCSWSPRSHQIYGPAGPRLHNKPSRVQSEVVSSPWLRYDISLNNSLVISFTSATYINWLLIHHLTSGADVDSAQNSSITNLST